MHANISSKQKGHTTSVNAIIIFCAQYLFIVILILMAIGWWQVGRTQKVRFIVTALIGGGLALLLSRIAAHMYYDPRPFVSLHITPLIAHAADNGFPSDHALLTGAVTAITFFYNKKIATVMAVFTVFVGAARVLAHVHSPLDIAAGWLFAAIAAVAAYYLTNLLFSRQSAKQHQST